MGGCAGTDRSAGNEVDVAPGAGASRGGGTAEADGGTAEAGGGTAEAGGAPVRVRVFADESLRAALTEVEKGYEAFNPNVEVVLTYGRGGETARRIADGEKADLLISDEPSGTAAVSGKPERIGRLSVLDLDPAGGPADEFATFLREGEGKRILIDSGLLRP
ncbi:hypothetical protein MB27_05875 [Actinoplanes utahensis]|uniref:PBP domain-containing protein n=1 Tax=Actinoplanes utahensis TaxID=1869 RepID=A0A0A6USG2_ACTUT|nr:hypothetical protein MB27_05875 [Actinoplanes utahensis]